MQKRTGRGDTIWSQETDHRNAKNLEKWFRKIGTMGTLASQAEIGVWVQSPGALLWRFCGGPGVSLLEIF